MVTRILVLSIVSHLVIIVSVMETDNSYHENRYNEITGRRGDDYMGPRHDVDPLGTVPADMRKSYDDTLQRGREEALKRGREEGGYEGRNPNEMGGYRGGGYKAGEPEYAGNERGHYGGKGGYGGGEGGYGGGEGGYGGGEGGNGGDEGVYRGEGGYRGGEIAYGDKYRGEEGGFRAGERGYGGREGRYGGADGGYGAAEGGYGDAGADRNRGGDGPYQGKGVGYGGAAMGPYRGADGGYRSGQGGYEGGDGGYRGREDGFPGANNLPSEGRRKFVAPPGNGYNRDFRRGGYDAGNDRYRNGYRGHDDEFLRRPASNYLPQRNEFRYGDQHRFKSERGRHAFGRALFRQDHIPDNLPALNEQGERILGVHYSLSEVLDVFNKNFSNSPRWYASDLLKIFNLSCRRYENKSIGPISDVQNRKRNIIINLEGTQREVKKNIAMMVARQLGAEMSLPPASILSKFRPYFTNTNIELKRAYFSLNYYAMADAVKGIIRTVPIVMSSYFMDQCAYGLIKYFDDLPPANDTVYEWPSDLLKPDVIFFLNLPEPVVYRSETNFFRIKLIDIYRKVKSPKVVEINSTNDAEEVVSIVLSCVNKILDGEPMTK